MRLENSNFHRTNKGSDSTDSAPTTSHLNVVVQSPSLHWGGSKWLVNSPRVSFSGDSSLDNSSSHFYPCCPMCGHIWTAFLNQIDRTIFSTFFQTTLLSPYFHPKPLHYSSHPPLILIFMLLLISGDIHPNSGPIDPCSVCSCRVTWETDRYNVATVLSGCTFPALVFLPLTFVKSPWDILGLSQCAHPLLNPSPPSHTPILYLHPSLYLHPLTLQISHPHSQTPTKQYLQK